MSSNPNLAARCSIRWLNRPLWYEIWGIGLKTHMIALDLIDLCGELWHISNTIQTFRYHFGGKKYAQSQREVRELHGFKWNLVTAPTRLNIEQSLHISFNTSWRWGQPSLISDILLPCQVTSGPAELRVWREVVTLLTPPPPPTPPSQSNGSRPTFCCWRKRPQLLCWKSVHPSGIVLCEEA